MLLSPSQALVLLPACLSLHVSPLPSTDPVPASPPPSPLPPPLSVPSPLQPGSRGLEGGGGALLLQVLGRPAVFLRAGRGGALPGGDISGVGYWTLLTATIIERSPKSAVAGQTCRLQHINSSYC